MPNFLTGGKKKKLYATENPGSASPTLKSFLLTVLKGFLLTVLPTVFLILVNPKSTESPVLPLLPLLKSVTNFNISISLILLINLTSS